jgi:hypothetical protein
MTLSSSLPMTFHPLKNGVIIGGSAHGRQNAFD